MQPPSSFVTDSPADQDGFEPLVLHPYAASSTIGCRPPIADVRRDEYITVMCRKPTMSGEAAQAACGLSLPEAGRQIVLLIGLEG
jgi:hypothetical protein